MDVRFEICRSKFNFRSQNESLYKNIFFSFSGIFTSVGTTRGQGIIRVVVVVLVVATFFLTFSLFERFLKKIRRKYYGWSNKPPPLALKMLSWLFKYRWASLGAPCQQKRGANTELLSCQYFLTLICFCN